MGAEQREFCRKCEIEIDRDRVIDFTLKSGKRVCEQCFIRETPGAALIRTNVDPGREMGNRLIGDLLVLALQGLE
jgi:hypothetical protein